MSCPKWPRCKGTYKIGKCHESQVLTRVGRGERQSRPLVSWWPRINLPIGLTLKLLETNMQSIGNTTNEFLGNYPWRPSYTNFLRKPKVGYPWISHIHKMPSISNFQLQLHFSPRRPQEKTYLAQPWCFTDLRMTICCQLKNSLFQARQRSQAVNLPIPRNFGASVHDRLNRLNHWTIVIHNGSNWNLSWTQFHGFWNLMILMSLMHFKVHVTATRSGLSCRDHQSLQINKFGYVWKWGIPPNYSHLVGIMIINHWVQWGTLFSDKPILKTRESTNRLLLMCVTVKTCADSSAIVQDANSTSGKAAELIEASPGACGAARMDGKHGKFIECHLKTLNIYGFRVAIR